jgi:hypothetical protein
MLRLAAWITTTAVLAFLLWQAAMAEPFLPRAVSGVLLVVISILAGLRISADSANAYMQDLERVNKMLADQNRELEDANAMLLRQVSLESRAS